MSKIKVMVIDDSTTICRSAELFLSNAGFEVFKVGDGFESLSEIMDKKPDLVFVDVLMPKLDGLQTCQIIKRNPDLKDMPIIFLSSKDGEFDKARGYMVGASDYLTKPFTKDQIIDMVKKHTVNKQ